MALVLLVPLPVVGGGHFLKGDRSAVPYDGTGITWSWCGTSSTVWYKYGGMVPLLVSPPPVVVPYPLVLLVPAGGRY
jgi:hypothetical protein